MDPTAVGYESAKKEWTDQFVEVVSERPELARFAGRVGRVVTVNCNLRALVEFATKDKDPKAGYASEDGGWYDIGLEFLRKLDQTEAKGRYDHSANSAKPFPPKQG